MARKRRSYRAEIEHFSPPPRGVCYISDVYTPLRGTHARKIARGTQTETRLLTRVYGAASSEQFRLLRPICILRWWKRFRKGAISVVILVYFVKFDIWWPHAATVLAWTQILPGCWQRVTHKFVVAKNGTKRALNTVSITDEQRCNAPHAYSVFFTMCHAISGAKKCSKSLEAFVIVVPREQCPKHLPLCQTLSDAIVYKLAWRVRWQSVRQTSNQSTRARSEQRDRLFSYAELSNFN